MKFLAEILHQRSSSRVLWYAPGGQAVTYGAVAEICCSSAATAWYGRRVALGAMSSLDFARILVLLDGLVECILLLPIEQSRPLQMAYINAMEIDVVLGGDGLHPNEILKDDLQTTTTDRTRMQPLPRIATQWILPTSGTTGAPKLIKHTLATLTRGMSERELGAEYVWGSLYHPRRFAGLQVFLQAWLSGTSLILEDNFEVSPDYLLKLADYGCNALSATPSMWRKLAMCPGFESLPLKQITLGGELVDQPILDLLRRSFPAARITHIYASTEAGVGFSVRDGLAGFPTYYLDVPPRQVEIRIGEGGRLWFRPSGKAPEEIGVELNVSNGWIDSGDLVKVTGERVVFLGRANGSINVGGNKVMPEEVEAIIKEVQGVAFVIVKGHKNSIMGNLVEAHVSTNEGVVFDDRFKQNVIEHCRKHLEAFKVPAFVRPIDHIRLNAVGKISRQEPA